MMSRVCFPAVLAGTLVVALGTPAARAEDPTPPPQPAAPAPAAPAAGTPALPAKEAPPVVPAKEAPAAAPAPKDGARVAPAADPRDQEITELRRIVEDAVRRIAELEKGREIGRAHV